MANDMLKTEIVSKREVSSTKKSQAQEIVKENVSLFDKILQKNSQNNSKIIPSKEDTKVTSTKVEGNIPTTESKKVLAESKSLNAKPSLLDNMLKNINLHKKNVPQNSKIIEETQKKETLNSNEKKEINLKAKVNSSLIANEIKIDKNINDSKVSDSKKVINKESKNINDNSKSLNTDNDNDVLNQKNVKIDININKINDVISKKTNNIDTKNTLKEKTSKENSDVSVLNEKIILVNKHTIPMLEEAKKDVKIVNTLKSVKNVEVEKIIKIKESIILANEKEIPKDKIVLINELDKIDNKIKQNSIPLKNDNVLNKVVSLNTDETDKSNNNTLLSQLIQNASTKETTVVVNNNATHSIDKSYILKDNIKASHFLNNQNINKKIISRSKINESKEVLLSKEIKSSKEKIIKSSKTLELNPSKVEISNDKDEKKKIGLINTKLSEQNNFLNKVFLNKNLNMDQVVVNNNLKNIEEIKAKEVQNTKENSSENETIVNMEATTLQNISTKIISARQNITSFMSDLARKMYENYKPPITTFKINLNPSTLGSISIIIKSNKIDNSMSVSMSASQGSTLDVLEEHKSILQNSLQKTFNSEDSVSLDFNMQGDNNTQDKTFKQGENTSETNDDALNSELLIEKNVQEQNQDYM